MSWTKSVAVCVLAANLVGCASFSSTFLHRDEFNQKWEKERCLRGVPVTLKVPTHLKIDIVEKYYLYEDEGKILRLPIRVPIRDVVHTFLETEKLFVVDLKRPAAGTLDTTLKFDAERQYFTNIDNRVRDETIARVTDLIAAVAPGGILGAPASGPRQVTKDEPPAQIREIVSTVASHVFELDAPDLEYQVRGFLDIHLNCCHDCRFVPPSPDRGFLPTL